MANDHDLLIQLNTQVGLLCKQIADDNGDMKDSLTDIYNKIDDDRKSFLPWKWFTWITGIIILGILTLSGIVYNNSININDLTHKVGAQQTIEKKIPTLRR